MCSTKVSTETIDLAALIAYQLLSISLDSNERDGPEGDARLWFSIHQMIIPPELLIFSHLLTSEKVSFFTFFFLSSSRGTRNFRPVTFFSFLLPLQLSASHNPSHSSCHLMTSNNSVIAALFDSLIAFFSAKNQSSAVCFRHTSPILL